MSTKVFLTPGFFGFTSLGAINYFHRVSAVLAKSLAERGVDAEIIECPTQPTGSIGRRALRVLEHVAERVDLDRDDLHFVGHSTGGLDLRLLLSPGVRLRSDDIEERLATRTRSATTVSTPHFGTPLASFFTTAFGRQLLEILTAMATTTGGRYSILAAARLLRTVARFDDLFGQDRTFLDAMVGKLLARITGDENDPVWQFLREVSNDQGAIIQLTPESMHLYNAAVTDHPGVRYASLVTIAPPPPRAFFHSHMNLSRAALGTAFALLYLLAKRQPKHYPYPHPGTDVLDGFRASVPFPIDGSSNDGVVPTLSQTYGEILDVVVADHLDIVGQFSLAGGVRHSDWLPSGSQFSEDSFRRAWAQIAGAIARA